MKLSCRLLEVGSERGSWEGEPSERRGNQCCGSALAAADQKVAAAKIGRIILARLVQSEDS
jgi:hypothetical protein